MFRKKDEKNIEIVNENKNVMKEEVLYSQPEILMIDCEESDVKKLRSNGYNIETASFGKIYPILDRSGNMAIELNYDINNIVEKDVIIINMKQRKTDKYIECETFRNLPSGLYFSTNKNETEFNAINATSYYYKTHFQKLANKDSIIILFADKEYREKYTIKDWDNNYLRSTESELSNFAFLPFRIDVCDNEFTMHKHVNVARGILKNVLKNYKGKIYSRCSFYIPDFLRGRTERIIENTYGELTGYMQFEKNDNETLNTLIVLPQFEDTSIVIENILTEVLPNLYPEIFKEFVKDTWTEKEEYLLPDVKIIEDEKEQLEESYSQKIKELEDRKKEKLKENEFLYNIIKSSGTGDFLVKNIIKCLEYIGYFKVEDCDKLQNDDDKEEDIHIYKNDKEYFIAEVKGVNGPPIEDDCNVIVKYKSRNCSKLKIPNIHGAVFVNYHKNVEPNKREELGFTKKEINDAKRDGYTLIGTYDFFKAIRLYQENIISADDIRRGIETPGIFKAIPLTYEKIGKIEDILNKINVICVSLECEELKINDELLVVDDNNYHKVKVIELQVNDDAVDIAKRGEKTGIKINVDVRFKKSSQIYIIKN